MCPNSFVFHHSFLEKLRDMESIVHPESFTRHFFTSQLWKIQSRSQAGVRGCWRIDLVLKTCNVFLGKFTAEISLMISTIGSIYLKRSSSRLEYVKEEEFWGEAAWRWYITAKLQAKRAFYQREKRGKLTRRQQCGRSLWFKLSSPSSWGCCERVVKATIKEPLIPEGSQIDKGRG